MERMLLLAGRMSYHVSRWKLQLPASRNTPWIHLLSDGNSELTFSLLTLDT
jgi:hypothetical protein